MSLPTNRWWKPEANETTPYDRFVALPGSIRRGNSEEMPEQDDELAHALIKDPETVVLTFYVRDGTFHPTRPRPVGNEAQWVLPRLWATGRLARGMEDVLRGQVEPRVALRCLLPELQDRRVRHLLLVIRVPVGGGRTLGIGFATDTAEEGRVLWDKTGLDAWKFGAWCVRHYGGGEAREALIVRNQRDMAKQEAEFGLPGTRTEAVRLALEHALRRYERIGAKVDLDRLAPDLRIAVETNLAAFWDDATDEPRSDFEPRDLVRWVPLGRR